MKMGNINSHIILLFQHLFLFLLYAKPENDRKFLAWYHATSTSSTAMKVFSSVNGSFQTFVQMNDNILSPTTLII